MCGINGANLVKIKVSRIEKGLFFCALKYF